MAAGNIYTMEQPLLHTKLRIIQMKPEFFLLHMAFITCIIVGESVYYLM